MGMGWIRIGLPLLAALLAAGPVPAADVGAAAPVPELRSVGLDGLAAPAVLALAREIFPRDRIEVEGVLSTAEERGMNPTERPYALELDWDAETPRASVALYAAEGDAEPLLRAEITRRGGRSGVTLRGPDGTVYPGVRLNTPVGESDITWMDLTMDYLWWSDARFLTDDEIGALKLPTRTCGRSCRIIEAKPPEPVPGCSAVRLWIDEGTGYMLQAEQLNERGVPVRRMWVQRIGREEGRWVPREFRIRVLGFRRVTSLWVRSVRSGDFEAVEEERR